MHQLGMLMFVVSNVLGSTIQITTLPLPVLSTLQAVRSLVSPREGRGIDTEIRSLV